MTMEALNGSRCQNDTIVITEPSAVAFTCDYEIDQATTTEYSWTMDGAAVAPVTGNPRRAHVDIPAGTHTVTCMASINVSHIVGDIPGAENCTCREYRTFTVIVVGAYRAVVSSSFIRSFFYFVSDNYHKVHRLSTHTCLHTCLTALFPGLPR